MKHLSQILRHCLLGKLEANFIAQDLTFEYFDVSNALKFLG